MGYQNYVFMLEIHVLSSCLALAIWGLGLVFVACLVECQSYAAQGILEGAEVIQG